MILVAGLSPAWQRILQFDEFRAGKVNRARNVVETPSGKPINVALGLHHLEADQFLITTLGGERGKQISKNLLEELDGALHVIHSKAPTRLCQTLLDSSGSTTELVEETPALDHQEIEAFLHSMEFHLPSADSLVLTGSVPPNVPKGIYRNLLAKHDGLSVVDAQGELLRLALEAHPTLIKPNREELERTVGRELDSTGATVEAARELQYLGAKWVIVTNGADEIVIVGKEKHDVFTLTPPAVTDLVNPVGCGDAFTAGLIANLKIDSTDEILQAVKRGVACAAQNLSMLLPCRLDPEKLNQQIEHIAVERWS